MFRVLGSLSRALHRSTRGWHIALFLALFLLFNILVWAPAEQQMHARGASGPIDLKFYYTPDDVYTLVGQYGDLRSHYALLEVTADIVYPFIYTSALCTAITKILHQFTSPSSSLRMFNVYPLSSAIFDLSENVGIVTMLTLYPMRVDNVARVTCIFTMLKWSSLVLSLGFVIGGALLIAIRKLSARK
jgi:hypothetical protein